MVTQSACELYGEVFTTPILTASDCNKEKLENMALELENQRLRLLDEATYITEEKQRLQITPDRINSDTGESRRARGPLMVRLLPSSIRRHTRVSLRLGRISSLEILATIIRETGFTILR